jgi:hypothetical protein
MPNLAAKRIQTKQSNFWTRPYISIKKTRKAFNFAGSLICKNVQILVLESYSHL